MFLIMENEQPRLLCDDLKKAKEFCIKQEYPGDYTIIGLELNEEIKYENPYWYYVSSDNKWYRG